MMSVCPSDSSTLCSWTSTSVQFFGVEARRSWTHGTPISYYIDGELVAMGRQAAAADILAAVARSMCRLGAAGNTPQSLWLTPLAAVYAYTSWLFDDYDLSRARAWDACVVIPNVAIGLSRLTIVVAEYMPDCAATRGGLPLVNVTASAARVEV